jgi:hypothetical protein
VLVVSWYTVLHRLLLHCRVMCSCRIHVVSSVSLLSEGRRRMRTRMRCSPSSRRHRRVLVVSSVGTTPSSHHHAGLFVQAKEEGESESEDEDEMYPLSCLVVVSLSSMPSRWMKSEGDAWMRADGRGVDASWHCDGTPLCTHGGSLIIARGWVAIGRCRTSLSR